MAALTSAQLAGIFKRTYSKSVVENLAYNEKKRKFLAAVKKNPNFSGDAMGIAILHDDFAGSSHTLSSSQTASTHAGNKQFLLSINDLSNLYQSVTFDVKTLRALKDTGSFIDKSVLRVNHAINGLSNKAERAIWRTRSAVSGTIANSTLTTTALTLNNASDAVNFTVGDTIVFAADTSSGLRNSGGSLTVSKIDRVNGVLTVSANISTVTGTSQNDSIFLLGDYVSSGDQLGMIGVPEWIPSSAPASGDSFLGVNRSTDPDRLAGVRVTGSLSNISDGIDLLCSTIGQVSLGMPDKAFCHPDIMRKLLNQYEGRTQTTAGGKAVIGNSGAVIETPSGSLELISSPFVPNNRVYALQMDTWEMISLGECIDIQKDDGLELLRQATSDGLELRVVGYATPVCHAPGFNGVVTFS